MKVQVVNHQEPARGLRAAEMPTALQELVAGVESPLKADSGGISELYSRNKNCPLAQNLNINCTSVLCFTWAFVAGIR